MKILNIKIRQNTLVNKIVKLRFTLWIFVLFVFAIFAENLPSKDEQPNISLCDFQKELNCEIENNIVNIRIQGGFYGSKSYA